MGDLQGFVVAPFLRSRRTEEPWEIQLKNSVSQLGTFGSLPSTVVHCQKISSEEFATLPMIPKIEWHDTTDNQKELSDESEKTFSECVSPSRRSPRRARRNQGDSKPGEQSPWCAARKVFERHELSLHELLFGEEKVRNQIISKASGSKRLADPEPHRSEGARSSRLSLQDLYNDENARVSHAFNAFEFLESHYDSETDMDLFRLPTSYSQPKDCVKENTLTGAPDFPSLSSSSTLHSRENDSHRTRSEISAPSTPKPSKRHGHRIRRRYTLQHVTTDEESDSSELSESGRRRSHGARSSRRSRVTRKE